MAGCFRYPGGKARVADMLLSFMPSDTQEFRECFVGGGGVYFGLAPNQVSRRWINDINPHLISVYRAFQEKPEEFIALCRTIKPIVAGEVEVSTKGTGKKYNQRLGEWFNRLAANEVVSDDPLLQSALRYFFINRTVWAGRVNYDPAFASRLYYSNPTGWNITAKKGYLEKVAQHIVGTKITCGDYTTLLSTAGENVWVYLDPPYVIDTKLNNGSKLYQFGFTWEEHARFVEECKRTKHKILISYDDVPDVRKWFSGFDILEKTWKHCGTSLEEKKDGKELLIANYDISSLDEKFRKQVTVDMFA